MADNLATAIKNARILAIVHVIVGILLVCLGIIDRLMEISIGGYICMGIWTGIWVSRIVSLFDSSNADIC